MSNELAVASVSFVLVDLLNNGLIDRDIGSAVGEVIVSALAPDLVDSQQNGKSRLNLFLYNITQNEGWRNVNYPSRNAAGERIDNPPLALNLHYLMTAYGAEQFHAEILLGYGMHLLHETPVLARNAIRRSLAAPSQVASGGGLPGTMLNLFTSDLADQVELIKIWPQTLSTEEISRLWTAFQAKYRPTAAYQVSVVLIQSTASTKKALPVQSRSVTAVPFQKPVIDRILSRENPNSPTADQPILAGYELVLNGSELKGQITTVLFGTVEVTPAAADTSASTIIVALPGTLQPGTQSVTVVQSLLLGSPPVPHRTIESDPAVFVLRASIQNVALLDLQGTGSQPRSGQLQITLDLAVGATQTVLVMLNQLLPSGSSTGSPLAYSFPVPPRIALDSPPPNLPPPTNVLSVAFAGVVAGDYLIRVQVDGAESPLTQGGDGRLIGPKVAIA
jgi:Pvc16 N-terminal domain